MVCRHGRHGNVRIGQWSMANGKWSMKTRPSPENQQLISDKRQTGAITWHTLKLFTEHLKSANSGVTQKVISLENSELFTIDHSPFTILIEALIARRRHLQQSVILFGRKVVVEEINRIEVGAILMYLVVTVGTG